jgi:hypothetical protein
MSILSLGQIVGNNQQGLYKLGERVKTAVSQISAAADAGASANALNDAVITPDRLQARINSFREASHELAKTVSEVAFSTEGAEQIEEQLKALQTQLSDALDAPLDEKTQKKINQFIQVTRTKIDAFSNQVQVPGGSDTATQEGQKTGNSDAGFVKLDSTALLGKKETVTTASDVREMLTIVQNAAGKISELKGDFRKHLESFESMALHLEISMENQIAAGSYLPQENLSVLDMLLGQAGLATQTQGKHLDSGVLNLI